MNAESERIKRALDIAGGAVGVALAAPLLALAALAIKLEDGGPILFRQTRLGVPKAPRMTARSAIRS